MHRVSSNKRGPLPWTESRDSQRLCASHAGREGEDGSAFHRAEPHHLPDSLSHCLLEDSALSRQTFWPCYAKNSFVSWLSVHAVLFHPGPVTLRRSDFCFHDALLTNKPNLLINIFPSSPAGGAVSGIAKGESETNGEQETLKPIGREISQCAHVCLAGVYPQCPAL